MNEDLLRLLSAVGIIGGSLFALGFFTDKNKRRNPDKWIQQAVDDPGRVRNYLQRRYGTKKAFDKDGDINMNTLNNAINSVESNPRRNRDHLLDALELAKRLKKGV